MLLCSRKVPIICTIMYAQELANYARKFNDYMYVYYAALLKKNATYAQELADLWEINSQQLIVVAFGS